MAFGKKLDQPEGYKPRTYEEPSVRPLDEIRADLDTDSEKWMKDLMASLMEEEMPYEQIYEQDERLRMMFYSMDSLDDTEPLWQETREKLDSLRMTYITARVEARERAEKRFAVELEAHKAEVKKHSPEKTWDDVEIPEEMKQTADEASYMGEVFGEINEAIFDQDLTGHLKIVTDEPVTEEKKGPEGQEDDLSDVKAELDELIAGFEKASSGENDLSDEDDLSDVSDQLDELLGLSGKKSAGLSQAGDGKTASSDLTRLSAELDEDIPEDDLSSEIDEIDSALEGKEPVKDGKTAAAGKTQSQPVNTTSAVAQTPAQEKQPAIRPNEPYQLLTKKQQKLLADDEFSDLSEMFDTKKRFRMFNSNSKEYKEAKEAFDDFMESRRVAKELLQQMDEDLKKGLVKEDAYRMASTTIAVGLDARAEMLKSKMKRYVDHSTMGPDKKSGEVSVGDKKQASGAARLSAAMGVLDALDRAYALEGKQDALTMEQHDERRKATDFRKLYNEEYKNAPAGSSDRHRKSAEKAQERFRQNAGAPVTGPKQ